LELVRYIKENNTTKKKRSAIYKFIRWYEIIDVFCTWTYNKTYSETCRQYVCLFVCLI